LSCIALPWRQHHNRGVRGALMLEPTASPMASTVPSSSCNSPRTATARPKCVREHSPECQEARKVAVHWAGLCSPVIRRPSMPSLQISTRNTPGMGVTGFLNCVLRLACSTAGGRCVTAQPTSYVGCRLAHRHAVCVGLPAFRLRRLLEEGGRRHRQRDVEHRGDGAALPCAGEIHGVVAEVGAPDDAAPVGVVAQLEHEGAGVAQDEVVRWDGQPAVAPLDPQRRDGVRGPSEEPQLRLRVGGAAVLRGCRTLGERGERAGWLGGGGGGM